jgi:hypothetical protein
MTTEAIRLLKKIQQHVDTATDEYVSLLAELDSLYPRAAQTLRSRVLDLRMTHQDIDMFIDNCERWPEELAKPMKTGADYGVKWDPNEGLEACKAENFEMYQNLSTPKGK